MAYQIKETFYQLRQVKLPPLEYYVVEQVFDTNRPQDAKVVMRGTFSQCQAWLDQRPGSAISIASE